MKKLLRMISIMLALSLFTLAGCTGGDKNTGSSNNSNSSDQSASDSDSTESSYDYGNAHNDTYDENYTNSLLDKSEYDFTVSQIKGTDSLGRKVDPMGLSDSTKYVGIFYFLWLGSWAGEYDISKMLEADPSKVADTKTNPLWANIGSPSYDGKLSPQNAFHYFEEPLYGYYRSNDKWVIKRHLEQLANAGVDFLYLDFTNAGISDNGEAHNIYKDETTALMECILELKAQGINAPEIVPIACNNVTNGGTKTITKVIEWLYNNYYAVDNFKYRDAWFYADETRNPSKNPLIVAYDFDSQYLSNKEIANAFWLRNVVWPTAVSSDSYKNGFPWMDYSLPQQNYDGIMNVSIAQHTGGSWSSEAFLARYYMNTGYKYRGRSANPSQMFAYETDNVEQALYGANFDNQWQNAINYAGDDDVWMVTVTGWNEWVAQKLNVNGQYATFVDTFNVAFSRDIEMMRDSNGYADNYYMQLAQNIRLFKGLDNKKNSNLAMWQKQTIDITDTSSFDNVKAKYIDPVGDAMKREHISTGGSYTYTDDSARNDISYVKIANDNDYLYVQVATKDNVTAHQAGDLDWMNIYLSTGKTIGWENYNFLINRQPVNNKTSIEALSVDNDNMIKTDLLSEKAEIHVEGKFIAYKIPLKALGVNSASEIEIKVCDNIYANKATQQNNGVGVYSFGNKMAFYCGGDSAPMGLLNYGYRMAY